MIATIKEVTKIAGCFNRNYIARTNESVKSVNTEVSESRTRSGGLTLFLAWPVTHYQT